MKRFGFKDFFIKPIFLSVATYFIVFFFFPGFSNEYLNAGFTTQRDSIEKVKSLSTNVQEKTGQSVEDMLLDLNTDELSDIVNSL